METTVKPIAVVQGAASAVVQHLLADFAARWKDRARIVGLVEEPQGVPGCAPGYLRSLVDGRRYPIFQELGPGSEACSLDEVSLVDACERLRKDIAAGCDLVIISKFGKLEAESRSGLLAACVDAIEAGIPTLTAVAPKFNDRWESFAAPFDTRVSAAAEAIDAWWEARRDAIPGNSGTPGSGPFV